MFRKFCLPILFLAFLAVQIQAQCVDCQTWGFQTSTSSSTSMSYQVPQHLYSSPINETVVSQEVVPAFVNVIEQMTIAVPKTTMQRQTQMVPVTTMVQQTVDVPVTTYEYQTVDVVKQYSYASPSVGDFDVGCALRAAEAFAQARQQGSSRLASFIAAGREYLTCTGALNGRTKRVGIFRAWRTGRKIRRRSSNSLFSM